MPRIKSSQLTAREIELARAVIDAPTIGLQYLAPTLGMNHQVLRNAMRRIYAKTGTDSRLHLTVWAWQNKIAPCPCGKP